MAQRFSSNAVISYFGGKDSEGLGEIVFDGSDDDLGMEEEEVDDSEPAFEPLEIADGGKIRPYIHNNRYRNKGNVL